MSPKIQAIVAGIVSGVTGFVSFIANTPPSQQAHLLGAIVDMVPVELRPDVAVWCRSVSTITGMWMAYKASHSGPQSPPVNKPSE
jgi:hypothetical protein